MIKIDLVDDVEKNYLEYKINKYVNDNLKIIIEVYLDYLNVNNGCDVSETLREVLPRDYVERKLVECRRLVDELYDIINSPFIRKHIKPKYEYLLHEIMYWWMETTDDEEDYIPIKLSNELKKEINDCKKYLSEDETNNLVFQELGDFEKYFEFCFYDHDFLPGNLERMVETYLKSLDIFNIYFLDVNLDDYIDLMPVDLRELYIEKKEEYKRLNVTEVVESTEECIVKEFYSTFQLIQNHTSEFEDKSEVEISNEIFRMTKRLFKEKFEVEIEREAEVGRANKKLGETDFLIYVNNKEYRNIAIIENKYIDKFLNAYGQLLGYLNESFEFGITISINKDKSLDEAMEFIVNKLKCIDDEQFKVVNIGINPFGDEYKYITYSEHILPEDKGRKMKLYHLILNLNDSDRKSVAKKSRTRKKSM